MNHFNPYFMLLFQACRQRNNAEIIRALVDFGATTVNVRNIQGRTPLHEGIYVTISGLVLFVAAQIGDEAVLRFMYRLKADANIVDNVSNG
jgi:hypothetical protein